jgi:hypothetical protein
MLQSSELNFVVSSKRIKFVPSLIKTCHLLESCYRRRMPAVKIKWLDFSLRTHEIPDLNSGAEGGCICGCSPGLKVVSRVSQYC